MFPKITILALVLVAANGQYHYEHDHNYSNGHAQIVSSQSELNLENSLGNGHYHVPLDSGTSNHASSGIAQHPAPVVESHHSKTTQDVQKHDNEDHNYDYYAHPKFQYEYKIADPHTGDHKIQHETRDGDVVKGYYSFQEADGSIRTVEYTSDKHKGFNAVVKHSAPAKHVESAQYYHH